MGWGGGGKIRKLNEGISIVHFFTMNLIKYERNILAEYKRQCRILCGLIFPHLYSNSIILGFRALRANLLVQL